jgi:hypothetical protein
LIRIGSMDMAGEIRADKTFVIGVDGEDER